MVNALQHNYKSGFVRSLLAQFAIYNVPVMKDPSKKPLMVYISLEDDEDVYVEFYYTYLYYNEHHELPDMNAVTTKEAATYIKKALSVNGYHIKMLRINPSEWTYKHLFNKILSYEADGYEVHCVVIDYLSKLPTTGCIQGALGVDYRDLYNRTRNFFSSKEILLISPHQLSTEAKQLIRNGISPVDFVKEVAGKGYTADSKQLDQVVDLELYLGKAKYKKKWVLTVQRGKDRRPGIVDDDKMYTMLPFPYKAPIVDDINDTDNNVSTDTSDGDDIDF